MFPYDWAMADGYPAKGIEAHNSTVFGTFVCGGGSTMGYKLAGYNHLGGVEIDREVATTYQANHNPKNIYIEDIREFNKREDLPDELYSLDLLDGSPPCSSFSTAGNREKDWGKKKVFAEGQEYQRLDDLVFRYVETIGKLRPKIAILENVAGIIKGSAKAYSKEIKREIENHGYTVSVFSLNSALMGLPQARQRVFFIGHQNRYKLPALKLDFDRKPVVFADIIGRREEKGWRNLTDEQYRLWQKAMPQHKCFADVRMTNSGFTDYLVTMNKPVQTMMPAAKFIVRPYPRHISMGEAFKISSFPRDYIFDKRHPQFYMGMSVPPVMTANIAHEIYLQWLSKINQNSEAA